jgi:hypothetical protein
LPTQTSIHWVQAHTDYYSMRTGPHRLLFNGYRPTQTSIQWVQAHTDFYSMGTDPHRLLFNGYRLSFPHVSRLGREVDGSALSGDEFKNDWSYNSAPLICFNGVDRGKFTFPFSSLRMGEHFTYSRTIKDEVAVYVL